MNTRQPSSWKTSAHHEQVDELLEDDETVIALCDEVLQKCARLGGNTLSIDRFRIDTIELAACVRSPILRLDSRFHRADVRAIVEPLKQLELCTLGSFLNREMIKGSQPELLAEDDGTGPRVVATSSIQSGQVIGELTKATSEAELDAAGPRKLERGDLLVTMDGEGSIGKAAVFDDDYPAVPDSHVAILRIGDDNLAFALACFLNSSFGQAQFMLATSGSTGQTQVSRGDLLAICVPEGVRTNARAISEKFRTELRIFENPIKRVRREICRGAAQVSAFLLRDELIPPQVGDKLSKLGGEKELFTHLLRLRPNMF